MSDFWLGFLVAWGIVSPFVAIFGFYYFVTTENFKKLKKQISESPEIPTSNLTPEDQKLIDEANKIIKDNAGKDV